jgi:hypothetical protein
MDLPEAGHGGRQLEVSTETLEARPVGQPFRDQAQELFHRLITRVAEVEPATLAAFPARHVDTHRDT